MKASTRLSGTSFEAKVATRPLVETLSKWVARAYLSDIPRDCFHGFLGRRLPEAGTQLVLSGDTDKDGRLQNLRLFVRGPVTRLAPSDAPSRQTAQVLVLDLRPGCVRTLLGVGAAALCDKEIDLEDMWGRRSRTLLEQLSEASSASQRLTMLEQALISILSRSRLNALPLSAAAHRLISSANGRIPISKLTDRLGVGNRLLHRRFIDEVGLPPKYCARIIRLRTLMQNVEAPECWAETADALGFSDQAHFIGDFRDLMGLSPARFFANEDFVPPLVKLGWIFTPMSDFSKTGSDSYL